MKLGFNGDVSNEDYHGDREYVSSSVLKLILKDPERYYKQYITGEVKAPTSNAFDFGSYIHTLVLEPHLVEEEYAFYQGAVRRGSAYDKFKLENKGKTIIIESQRISGLNLQEAVFANPAAKELFTDGKAEQTLCVVLDGVKVKVRCDYLKGTSIIDLKTTGGGATYGEVVETCIKYDYDLSAALYADAFTQITGKKHDFYFSFISKKSQEVCNVKASEQFLENGRRKYKAAIKKLKKARETGIYFDPNEVKEISLPNHALFVGE